MKPNISYNDQCNEIHAGTKLQRRYRNEESPPNFENLPFRRTNMAVLCTLAGQLTGTMTTRSTTVTTKNITGNFCRENL